MNKAQWLQSITTPKKINFQALYEGIIDVNKFVGNGRDDLTEDQLQGMIDSYTKFVDDEIAELNEAIDDQDIIETCKEAADVLVVAGMNYWLETGNIMKTESVANWDIPHHFNEMLNGEYSPVMTVITCSIIENFLENVAQSGVDVNMCLEMVVAEQWDKFPTVDKLFEVWDNPASGMEASFEDVIKREIQSIEKDGRYSGVYAEVKEYKDEERVVFWCKAEYNEPKKKYVKPSVYRKGMYSKIIK